MRRTITTVAAVALVIAVDAPLNAQQASRRGAAWRDIQGFNIVLVVGENKVGASSTEYLPTGAKKALDDMREFLPYKQYRVLDSQWTSCCSPESVRVGAALGGRLQGMTAGHVSGGSGVLITPRVYAFRLAVADSSDPTRIGVQFALGLEEPVTRRTAEIAEYVAASERARANRLTELRAEFETLSVQIQNLKNRVEVGVAPPHELRPMQDRLAQLQRQIAEMSGSHGSATPGMVGGARPIIDTSFTMDVGETVVVGTSRLGGDKALIAMVTAVRRSTSAR